MVEHGQLVLENGKYILRPAKMYHIIQVDENPDVWEVRDDEEKILAEFTGPDAKKKARHYMNTKVPPS